MGASCMVGTARNNRDLVWSQNQMSTSLQFVLKEADFELWDANRMSNKNELIEMEITPIWRRSKTRSLAHSSLGSWVIP